MSIGWIQPTMGLVFIVIWLISAHIVVGERGRRESDNSLDRPTAGDTSAAPTIQPHWD